MPVIARPAHRTEPPAVDFVAEPRAGHKLGDIAAPRELAVGARRSGLDPRVVALDADVKN